MINAVVGAILTWCTNYIVIPLSLVVIDYFRMRKTISNMKAEIAALKSANTPKEKDDAIDSAP